MSYELKSPVQFVLFVLFVLTFSLTVFITFFDGEQINKVDCYDKFSNKIIGEICEEVEFENQDILNGNMIVSILLLFSFTTVSLSNAMDFNNDINFFGFEKQRSTETK